MLTTPLATCHFPLGLPQSQQSTRAEAQQLQSEGRHPPSRNCGTPGTVGTLDLRCPPISSRLWSRRNLSFTHALSGIRTKKHNSFLFFSFSIILWVYNADSNAFRLSFRDACRDLVITELESGKSVERSILPPLSFCNKNNYRGHSKANPMCQAQCSEFCIHCFVKSL